MRLEMLERDYDLNTPEGKTGFMHEAAKRLAVFDEEIERSNYIEAVAKAYRVNVDELRKLVVRTAVQTGLAKPVEKPRTTRNREKEADDGILKSQRILLTWMIDDANVLQQIRRVIRSDDFTEPLYRTVAELLYQQMDEGLVNPAQILDKFIRILVWIHADYFCRNPHIPQNRHCSQSCLCSCFITVISQIYFIHIPLDQ